MSFRRFLYVVWDVEAIDGSCSLRRIDTSRLFFRTSTEGVPAPLDSGGGGGGATDPSAAHDGGRLPDPAIKLRSPILPREVGLSVMLGSCSSRTKAAMGGRGHELEHDKVVAIDRTCCSFMCDPRRPGPHRPHRRTLPTMTAPKFLPFSLTVGESLYVMDTSPLRSGGGQRHSFEVLSDADHRTFRGLTIKDWCWRPPSRRRRWRWRCRKPTVVRGVWKEYAEPPPEWTPASCYAVYLGSSKFCIVRFFYTGKVYVCPESHHWYKREEDLHAVITGVEVQGCGSDGGGDVQVVRHKSERYKVDVRLYYQLL